MEVALFCMLGKIVLQGTIGGLFLEINSPNKYKISNQFVSKPKEDCTITPHWSIK